jgi:hypothetical protein
MLPEQLQTWVPFRPDPRRIAELFSMRRRKPPQARKVRLNPITWFPLSLDSKTDEK